ncbi:hypothetical protein G4B88_029717 [Cannabis sativa]|uniref:Glutaredoxin domain-containing protein n=1 Tax=Cannabis sativa TaxID=3483 RepID=A0A7J6DN12_CANSA|nr:hypothetical protein G4B88_029717 [Cannabis sativa]
MARSLSHMLLKGISGLSTASSTRTATGSFVQYGRRFSNTNDSDTHDDFKPTSKLDSSNLSLKDIVEQDIKENPVMVYMKGVPDLPQCGFSSLAVRVCSFECKKYFGNPDLKTAVKAFSQWPTFPQIFIKGEFIGGSDIILNLHQTGELKEKLKDVTTNQEKSQ